MKRDFSEDKKEELFEYIDNITAKSNVAFDDFLQYDESGNWIDTLELTQYSSSIDGYAQEVGTFNTSVKTTVETKFQNIADIDVEYQKTFQELYNTIWFQLCKVHTLKSAFSSGSENGLIKGSVEIRAEEILLAKMEAEGITSDLEKQNIIQMAKVEYPQMLHNLYVTNQHCSSSCDDVYEQIRIAYDNEKSCLSNNECITLDGWLCLYSEPTVAGEGRVVPRHPDAAVKDWACPGDLTIKGDSNWFAEESHAKEQFELRGDNMEVKLTANNLYTNAEGRYWVAVGPNIINPEHTPNDAGVTAEEMKFGTKIDIVVRDDDGNLYYIPAVVGEGKEHSYPHGLYQTGVPFDSNRVSFPESAGNTVEFLGYEIDTQDESGRSTINITNDYELVEIIVYDENY